MVQTLTTASVEACDDDRCGGECSWNCHSTWESRLVDGCDVTGLVGDHVRDRQKNRSLYLEACHGTSEGTAEVPVWESQQRP